MGQSLAFFRQKPVHQELGRVGMRRIGERRYAATRSAGPHQAYLLGQKDLFDWQPFFCQRCEIFTACSNGLKRKSSSDEPGFQHPAIIRESNTGIEQICPYPLLTPVRFEITVDHLTYAGRIAHALAQNLAAPAR